MTSGDLQPTSLDPLNFSELFTYYDLYDTQPVHPLASVLIGPRYQGYRLNSPIPSLVVENDQQGVQACSSSECNTTLSDTEYPTHSFPACLSLDAIRTSIRATHIQTPHAPDLRNLSSIWAVPDALPAMLDGEHVKHMAPLPYVPHGVDWKSISLDEHISNPHSTFPSASYPYGRLMFHDVSETDLRLLGEPSGVPPTTQSLHTVARHLPAYSNSEMEPSLSHHIPLHQLLGPPSPQHTASQSSSPTYHPRRQHSTGSARHSRRRPARAIEYNSLWIDEAELLQGMGEPGENVSVHQCHWEEDKSPCYLSIKGDRSCINMHIQKWHRGKPGGDKLRVVCRWSGCREAMLKDSIARHILTVHLGEVWECQGCRKRIVRNDAYERHTVKSSVNACRTSGAILTYFDAKVINARDALNCGGNFRYSGV